MLFSDFASYLQRLESISSRLEITQVLAELYRALDPAEVPPASYLMQGSLVPAYQSLEFQLSAKMIIRALARVQADGAASESADLFGETPDNDLVAQLTRQFKTTGDVGEVAQTVVAARQTTEQEAFSLAQVYEALTAIAQDQGTGSQERKLVGLVKLLQHLDPVGAKYVVRIIMGRLRLGFSTMTMIDALSWAVTGGKAHRTLLEDAYQKKADIGNLAQFYLSQVQPELALEAVAQLLEQHYVVEVGIPVVPALCQRLNTATEIITKMKTVIVEPKYDGVRLQIHFQRRAAGDVAITAYTRNLEEVSAMFPELQLLPEHLQCQSCILDAEAVGYDPATGKLLLFQQTITRKRKHGIETIAAQVPIKLFVFDLLAVDGQPLIVKALRERKALLEKLFSENRTLSFTPSITTSDPDEIRSYHEVQLGAGLEGIVTKQLDAPYQSGRKGWSWVKMKEEEGSTGKLSDTLDVVVMGYYFGRGKRAAFGIGAFLVGVLTSDGQLQTIAKIGTGLSDELFRELKLRLDPLKTETSPPLYQVHKLLTPDVWVEPQLVVEVAADELTKSPTHTAGVALRFPRLVKIREDKSWQEATTVEELSSIQIA